MHSFLEFFFHHLETIIMSLAILGFSLGGAYIIYQAFFASEKGGTFEDTKNIEELLKKVLAQANNIGADKISVSSSNRDEGLNTVGDDLETKSGKDKSSPEKSTEKIAEIGDLKQQLKVKEREIETLKKDIEKKVDSKPSQELLDKIKDLEARLAEYEIIEDDIADLSKYKDENANLKEELEKLKSGAGASLDSETQEVKNDVEIEEESLDENSESVELLSEEADPSNSITDDLINEFEQAVNEQLGISSKENSSIETPEEEEKEIDKDIESKNSEESPEEDLFEKVSKELAAEKLSAKEPTVKKVSPTKKKAEEPIGADDIFGEFVPEDVQSSDMSSQVDTHRMLEEMSTLENLPIDESAESTLDQELDVEKMVNEAKNLDSKG